MGFLWQGTLLVITDDLMCDGETYKTRPVVYGHTYLGGVTCYLQFDGVFRHDENINERYGYYLTEHGGYSGISTVGNGEQAQASIIVYPAGSYTQAKVPTIEILDMRYEPPTPIIADYIQGDTSNQGIAEFSTNFPIFLSQPELERYIQVGDNIEDAVNYTGGEEKETKEYFYYGNGRQITVDQYGTITPTSAPSLYRGIRVKTKGTLSLYLQEGVEDGVLKYKLNIHDTPIIAYYSNDGDTWQNMPGSPTSLPYDYLYRYWIDEEGTFYASGTKGQKLYQTNIPIFSTKQESDDYNDTGEGIEGAINYPDIDTAPPTNTTGIEDEETEFGAVYTRSFFSQQYILGVGALSELANAFFDTTAGGAWDDIKKGLEMYGDSPVDDIQGLYYLPFDATQVFTNTSSQQYIYFGGYKFDFANSSVNKIIYPNGYYDFGSFDLTATFGNSWKSYEPYTKLYCYLAYIGWTQLDIKKYINKTVNVRYYFDTRTGGCVACLIANGVLIDFFNGQIGVQMPITATDFVAYANAQIQTLLTFGNGQKANAGAIYNTGANMAKAGASVGTIAGVGAITGGASLAIGGTKALYGLTQNNINNFNQTIGGSSSMLNMFLPQEVCFMFEVQDAMPTENEQSLQGYPSNTSGSIGSFVGYLEVDTVNLVCADATANEKAQIVQMLQNGVYI